MSAIKLMDAFFLGAVTGALLCVAIVVGYNARPRGRLTGNGESERRWMRAVESAFQKGREEGLEMRLPKPVLRIEKVGRGWRGTTRAAGLTVDRGEGAA
jgi:hypothetical protein